MAAESTSYFATPNGEPPMYLQRPSSGRSQDVRHILSHTFRSLYMRDPIRPETVENLKVSKGSDDPYHERYVEQLRKVYDEWQKRMDEVAMLERHIMQAQARAMSADERNISQVVKSVDNYDSLGLPPGRAHFCSCIDNKLLRTHKLITPEDYSLQDEILVPPPSVPPMPTYARETLSSQQHSRQNLTSKQQITPVSLEDGLEFKSNVSEQSEWDDRSLEEEMIEEKFPSKDAWKGYMRTEQRAIDRHDLELMQAKLNYLRNPRCIPPSESGNQALIKSSKRQPKEINIHPPPVKEIKDEAPIFIPSPSIVIFKDYKVGQVYEIVLELKNVSTVMRQCRVLPFHSSYFSVGLGQFPGENSLIAPGISCYFPIRFAPDSLKDYDDEIVIQTQSKTALVVPVQGRREPPILTIPALLDVGFCLVRGFQVTQFVICNEGGSGRFCIMPRSSWPATNFKSVILNGSVMLPPFELRPSTLELDRGQTTVIEVMFRPTAQRVFSQEFTILCDNCHVQHFTLKGEGQIVKVDLVHVERGESLALPGELCDRTAQHLLKFDDLNPFTYMDRTISVQNCTNVELPFHWLVYKPQMTMPKLETEGQVDTTSGSEPEEDRVPELDSIFSIQPSRGVLKPADITKFQISFAPPIIGKFHSVIHLLIQQVPTLSQGNQVPSNDGNNNILQDCYEELSLELEAIDGAEPQFQDMTALQIELKGSSVPLNVVLHPYAIYMPGKHLVGTTVKKLFTMANHSASTITFQWEPVQNSLMILEVEPPYGELDAGMAMDLELSVTGSEPCHISHTLFCYVHNMDEPLHLHVDTDIKGPEITIDEPSLNFGLVRLGDTVEKELTLTSMAQLITKWTLEDKPLDQDDIDDMKQTASEFTFIPASGELRPLEKKTVTVQYTPLSVSTVQRTFLLQVEEGNSVSLGVFAEVQKPVVCLQKCEIVLPEVYIGVPVVISAVLYNQTLLPTYFTWGQHEGVNAGDCSISIEESTGLLQSREEHPVAISFCAHREGDFTEVRIPCYIDGQDEAVFLNISCSVMGLSVTYKTSMDSQHVSDNCFLNFGEEVGLGEEVKRYLHIYNQSAITADFSLVMENFPALFPAPPQEERGKILRPMLALSQNQIDCQNKKASKSANDLKAAMLSHGKGAAFLLQPATGVLQPYGHQIIEITAFSNMWGKYYDNLVCTVGRLRPVHIPVTVNVQGCPLNFQMTAASPNQTTILRFGTLVAGVAPITRCMRVNNTSPNDIRVDWQVFNRPGTEKLIDIVFAYGRPFPLLDSQGHEVIPMTPYTTCPESDLVNRDNSCDVQSQLRPKVISLYIRSHDGVQKFEPYDINPRQLVIPAHKHANVNMTFSPPSAEEVTQDTDFFSYAVGFMSLDSPTANVSGRIERTEAYDASTLRAEFTSHVKPALLNIQEADEDGMTYQSAMSDLLDGEQLLPEFLRTCSLMLSNTTQTSLTFCLKVKPPFIMVDLDSSNNPKSVTRTNETGFHTLNPQHNIMVKVAFRITPSILLEVEKTQGSEVSEKATTENRLTITDHLLIEFNNTSQQKVPLFATVSVPQMKLSKSELDFGTCLVGQRRELQFVISNTTASHCSWVTSFESKSAACTQDTFQISPVHGLLEAHIMHISKSKMLLTVYFTAKHTESYEAVILFTGKLGEMPQRLKVQGCGSYDGKYESVLNI